MRIDLNTPGGIRLATVTLNGVDVSRSCRMADEEAGQVELLIQPVQVTLEGDLASHTLTGEVKISPQTHKCNTTTTPRKTR